MGDPVRAPRTSSLCDIIVSWVGVIDLVSAVTLIKSGEIDRVVLENSLPELGASGETDRVVLSVTDIVFPHRTDLPRPEDPTELVALLIDDMVGVSLGGGESPLELDMTLKSFRLGLRVRRETAAFALG